MTRGRAVFLALALPLAFLASCGRKAQTRAVDATPALPPPPAAASTSAQRTANTGMNFAEFSEQVRRAVVVVSVFDESGHLCANGHGFFVTDDGKFIADRSIMAGGVNAVAKAGNGSIYNVSGALTYAPGQNFVLLKADSRRVPFLTPSANSLPASGDAVAIVLSSVERAKTLILEEKIGGHFSDQSGEWFDVAPAVPRSTIGAPVINARGELVGIVGFRAENNSCVFRSAMAARTLLAEASST